MKTICRKLFFDGKAVAIDNFLSVGLLFISGKLKFCEHSCIMFTFSLHEGDVCKKLYLDPPDPLNSDAWVTNIV